MKHLLPASLILGLCFSLAVLAQAGPGESATAGLCAGAHGARRIAPGCAESAEQCASAGAAARGRATAGRKPREPFGPAAATGTTAAGDSADPQSI